jgi:hypothetical protein
MSRRRCFKKGPVLPYTLLDLGYDKETANWYRKEFGIYRISEEDYLKGIELQERYDPSKPTTLKSLVNELEIKYLPKIDVSNVTSPMYTNYFKDFTSVVTIPYFDFTSVISSGTSYNFLDNWTNLVGIYKMTLRAPYIYSVLSSCTNLKKVKCLDWQPIASTNAIAIPEIFLGCDALNYLFIQNVQATSSQYISFIYIKNWGAGGEKNRQSLVDTFITHLDYTKLNITKNTIRLHADVVARFTAEEIAYITNQGITLQGV